jgi:hypothetical protein
MTGWPICGRATEDFVETTLRLFAEVARVRQWYEKAAELGSGAAS